MSITHNHKKTLHIEGVDLADEKAHALSGGCVEAFFHPDQHEWTQIKQNASRTVYRKTLDGREVYLKHFHSRLWTHRLGRALGFSDARREMFFAQYLSRCGVETPVPLAYGCRGGKEWMATLGVTPSLQANVWQAQCAAQGPAGALKIRQLSAALGKMIAQMHNAGVLHGDLHSGNLLIRTDTPTPQPVLMDLHRMTKRPYLSRRARAKNLALLFHDRFDCTTRTERLRFLKHYLLASRIGGTLRGWQMMVTDFAWRHRQKLYAKRARRVVGNNRYFHRLRLNNGWRGHAVLESKRAMPFSAAAHWAFTPDQWKSLLSDPLKLLDEPHDRLIKQSGSGVVLQKKITVGGHVLEVVIKNPRRKKSWKILLDCFRPSRPMRAFKLGHALLTRNIPTALPLVALERKIGPLLLDSILITEYVPSQPLPSFLHHWLGLHSNEAPSLEPAERRRLAQHVIWQMGRLLQRLHDNRYHHRDLKGSNMLVYWSQQAPPEIVLIDLDGLKRVRRLTEKQRFQGLMRLNVSLLSCPPVNSPGQLRMLLGYLRRPGSGKINFKPYWRVLENWSQKKLSHQIRSLRKKQKAVRK